MPRYKRTFDEAELEAALEPVVQTDNLETQRKLRNMWEFASLMQYIYLFGNVVKIDHDLDIDDLETECLAPQPSHRLAQLGLQLLKFVSSHRGLTPEIFDEYTRRQYVAKAPHRNPYGEEEEPAKFDEFDIFTKVRVLHQLSTWTLGNPERIRGMMPQEEDQLGWRIEPIGWDREDRAYFVLDDDRLYRRTDEPTPPPTPKQKAKPKPKPKPARKAHARGSRTSKRLKVDEEADEELDASEGPAESDAEENTSMVNGEPDTGGDQQEPGFGFTGKTWECIAITLEEYRDFLASIFRTRDPNEKQLRRTIEEDVLPIIERRADQVRQKQIRKMRELENLQKMATAKRSSRLADKAEKEKVERDERDAEEKRQRELKMAHEEQERQRKIEEGHESRRLTREQRLRDREVKRILHEEELAKLEEAANRASPQDPSSDAGPDGHVRMSERQIVSQRERHQKELEKMAEEEENWIFDCAICGIHGENWDDGTHSIACERCSVWQHSKCHGFSPKQAEKDGFHFVCGTCKRKEAEAKKPKIPPLKLGKRRSPEVHILRPSQPAMQHGSRPTALPDHIARQLDDVPIYQPMGYVHGPHNPYMNGSVVSHNGQIHGQQYHQFPPGSNIAPQPPHPAQPWQGSPLPPASTGYISSPPPALTNGHRPPSQHQQQHQYIHQGSIASTGGHPGYGPPYNQQMYSYGREVPGGMNLGTSPSPRPGNQYSPPQSSSLPLPRHQQSRGTSLPSTNGAQSPTKQMPKSLASPPQPNLSGQPPPSLQPGQYPGYNARASPYGLQPPPPSSAPVAQPYNPQSLASRPSQSPHQLSKTPLALRNPSVPDAAVHDRTPQPMHPSPASSNAGHVAADGMSGPWPEAGKAIPQKSPVPPQIGHVPIEGPVVPPVSLAPSPNQQQQFSTGPGSVPVKKMPAQEGSPTSPALDFPPPLPALVTHAGSEKSLDPQASGALVEAGVLSNQPGQSTSINGSPSAHVEGKTSVPTGQASSE